LLATEDIEEFDDQESKSSMIYEENEESCNSQLSGIGNKSSTGGWFVSERGGTCASCSWRRHMLLF
jgi:hypothetical protein